MVGSTNYTNNVLLPILFCVLWISYSSDTSIMMTVAIKDVGRRKLATQDRPGFLSIDCGVDEDYLNIETGIYYKSDKDFVKTGENHDVLPKYGGNPFQEYNNLRSFPQGKRNCYTLNPEQGKNNYYLIRALFLYGNYDGNSKVPEFDLYIGVNYWTTVKVLSESDRLFREIVYFFPADNDYLCLVNTGSGIPFISALELRFYDSSLVNKTGHGALNHWAFDFGISMTSFFYRYKDDVYDRFWQWYSYPTTSSVAINTSLNIDTRGTNGSAPVEVLRTALRSPNGSNSLTFSYNSNSFPDQYFFLFHFAEIEGVAQNLLREFTISVNGFKSQPIRLEYLKPLSLIFQNWTVIGGFNVTLDATVDSDLPPILNAVEIYQVHQLSFSPTDQSDVYAIMEIKHTYNINKDDWQGDPCLPKEYTWSGIGCKFNSSPPRIISLNMSGCQLTGEISSSFSDLQAIEWLDLSKNELSGQVPEVLAQLPNLKVLNLSGNKFTGSIPQSLKDKSNNGSLVLSLVENLDLCQMDPCHREEKNFVVPIVASVASAVILISLSILLVVYKIKRRRKRETFTRSREGGSFKSKNRPFSYSQIVRITGNFTTIVGKGGFGNVYLGTLADNTRVAVKVLSKSSNQGYKEFRSEAQLLMIVHHRNLVSLIGYCDEKGKIALIYEYMENGNLRQHLSGKNTINVLNWQERLQIAIDAANGLEYLHNGCKPPIIHRDMKSANILLTENKQAKISDFGLSRIFITENVSHISTCPAGTPGYLDPEFQVSGNLTKKSDVYSFGIILFELITGQPAIIRNHEENIHIVEWLNTLVGKGDIRRIVEPGLQGEFDVNAAWKLVEIAMSCTHRSSARRPDMSSVLTELKECMAIEMALIGRTQRMQNNMTVSENSIHMSLAMDSDMIPTPR